MILTIRDMALDLLRARASLETEYATDFNRSFRRIEALRAELNEVLVKHGELTIGKAEGNSLAMFEDDFAEIYERDVDALDGELDRQYYEDRTPIVPYEEFEDLEDKI